MIEKSECTCRAYTHGGMGEFMEHYKENKAHAEKPYDIDFKKNFYKMGTKGDMWHYTTCKICGGIMPVGGTFCSSEKTKEEIIVKAYEQLLAGSKKSNLTLTEIKDFIKECLIRHGKKKFIDVVDRL